jgi:peptidoglycan biosynthesis protein MviN/MurJ (putative lipid II flippase)
VKGTALDRALARGMLLAALFAAVAGAARVAQDAAIAWRYGTGPAVDAYYFLLSLASWPMAVALSTFTFLLAPAEATSHGLPAGAHAQRRGVLLGRMLVAAALSLPLAWLALDGVVASGLSGLRAAAADAARAGVPLLVAGVPLGLVGALLSAWLIGAGRHVLTLLEALPALTLTVLLLALPGQVLFWGTAAGIALQVLAMAMVMRAAGDLPRPRLTTPAGATGPTPWLAQGALLLVAGQMLFTLFPLVDPFFAARLSEGTVAAMGFASRLVLGLQGLAGLALQRAGLPLLSRLAASSPDQMRHTVMRWTLAAMLSGMALGMVVAAGADRLVGLMFERGSFTAQDRAQVAELLRYGMLQMPPFLAGTVLVTALAATRGGTAMAQAAAAGLVAKVALSTWLVASHGAHGLLVATALMYTITATLVWLAMFRPASGAHR